MKNILLVEDDSVDARIIQGVLARSNATTEFAIETVPTLKQAIRALADPGFDIVLLDLSLPDSNGLGTVEALIAAGQSPPIVILSGLEDENLALEAVKCGAQDYLVKGQVGTKQLTRTLRYAIERRHSQQELLYLAQHDSLTGLINRALLYDRLRHALTQGERLKRQVAVLFLDLDGFKAVNDTHGHAVGDRLLETVARRLETCIRKSDSLARLGGDEFVAVLENLNNDGGVELVAQHMLNEIRAPFPFIPAGDPNVAVSASIGIACYPFDGPDEETLLNSADRAMYQAKNQGGNRCVHSKEANTC